MQKKKSGLPFLLVIIMVGILPLLASAISLTLVARAKMTEELETGVYNRLQACATSVVVWYEYDIRHDELSVDPESKEDTGFIDSLESQEIELTLFQGDTRVMTSIKKSDGPGGRNIGTTSDVWNTVKNMKSDEVYEANNVVINGEEYYVAYVPLTLEDGTVWGMGFAGEKEAEVERAIAEATTFLVIIAVALVVACAVIVVIIALVIKKPIGQVATSMNYLSEGDLTHKVEIKSGVSEINELIVSAVNLQSNLTDIIQTVNAKSDTLNGNVDQITENVITCNRATEGIVSAVDELAKGSMEMAESVQNTAESMNGIGDAITGITELATEANTTATEVKDISVQAKKNLQQLITANGDTVVISKNVVEGILESSAAVEEIRKAADVIADIASQTNLLSLNASIEAARAGEAGRGFAVVAGEISSLAAQSDASTKEIKEVIENIINKTENSVKLANKIQDAIDNEGKVLADVSSSFDEVNTRIETTADAINSIANQTDNLNGEKNKVLDEVSTLSSISEENAASCEETTSSMQELGANMAHISTMAEETKEASDELREAVAYFKL